MKGDEVSHVWTLQAWAGRRRDGELLFHCRQFTCTVFRLPGGWGEMGGGVRPMTGLLQRCKELLYSLSASLLFASLYHGSSGSPQTDAARLSP